MGKFKLLEGRAERQVHELDKIFSTLADESRRNIMSLIISEEMTVTEMSKKCCLTLASAFKHIRVLVKAKLVRQKSDGRKRICKVYPEGIPHANIWLSSLGLIDVLDLANLEEFLESEKLL